MGEKTVKARDLKIGDQKLRDFSGDKDGFWAGDVISIEPSAENGCAGHLSIKLNHPDEGSWYEDVPPDDRYVIEATTVEG